MSTHAASAAPLLLTLWPLLRIVEYRTGRANTQGERTPLLRSASRSPYGLDAALERSQSLTALAFAAPPVIVEREGSALARAVPAPNASLRSEQQYGDVIVGSPQGADSAT